MNGKELEQFEKKVKDLTTSDKTLTAYELAKLFWLHGRKYEQTINPAPVYHLPYFNPHDPQQLSMLLQMAASTSNGYEQHHGYHHHHYDMAGKVVYDHHGPYSYPDMEFRFKTENLIYFVERILKGDYS
jgi:hypothetical protein